MKVMLWSVHPLVASGYGQGCLRLADIITKLGHDLTIQSTYGNYSYIDNIVLNNKNIKIYPAKSPTRYGADVIELNCLKENPDVIITFFDIFVGLPLLKNMASLLMVDSSPFQHINLKELKKIKTPVIVTKWAESQIHPAFLNSKPIYMPIPISDEYYPSNMLQSRQYMSKLITDSTIDFTNAKIISVVSNNFGDPGRKNLNEIIRAWGDIANIHPNTYLYLHTDVTGTLSKGINIRDCIAYCNYPRETISRIIYPNYHKYYQSEYTREDMRHIYNSSDIYLNPSNAEGFGMPLVESMCCGTIPLVTNFGATKELVESCIPDEYKDKCLLDGFEFDVGEHGRRYYVGSKEIASKTINLLNNLPNIRNIISIKARSQYQDEGYLMSLMESIIQKTAK